MFIRKVLAEVGGQVDRDALLISTESLRAPNKLGDASISRSLSEGVPRISDEARHQLSARLLAGTDYSLGEVSFMAGFADQSAFTRAFRRWEGQTPRSYRLRRRPAAG